MAAMPDTPFLSRRHFMGRLLLAGPAAALGVKPTGASAPTVDEARRIAHAFYKADGPLLADDVVGATASTNLERARLSRLGVRA